MVTLRCAAVSNLPLKYQWYKDGIKIGQLTSQQTYSLNQVVRQNSGQYTCEINSRLSNRTSMAKSLNIKCKNFNIPYINLCILFIFL